MAPGIFIFQGSIRAGLTGGAVLLALSLPGCGLVPMVAQRTAEGFLAPVTAAAQIVNADLQLLGRTMTASAAQTSLAARQVSTCRSAKPMPPPPRFGNKPRRA